MSCWSPFSSSADALHCVLVKEMVDLEVYLFSFIYLKFQLAPHHGVMKVFCETCMHSELFAYLFGLVAVV